MKKLYFELIYIVGHDVGFMNCKTFIAFVRKIERSSEHKVMLPLKICHGLWISLKEG